MVYIRFEEVTIKAGGKILLKDFILDIEKNDKIIFMGKSGIGKSTIIKTLLGFHQIEKGKILFRNKEIKNDLINFRKKFSYLPQNTNIYQGKVIELFQEIASYKNSKLLYDQKSLDKELKFFELEKDILKKDFTSLSGGEKQKTLLILAFLLARGIFLLDEPTASLDASMKNKVIKRLEGMNSTIIVISHDKGWNNKFKKIKVGK
ncbi:ABC transporter ATP-binding protein [Candidatus Woesearchaeota archaeon]|nr:MAG: ABC transporter ATP-binding protein [Candidatus Woesearchaeota archaeon]